MSVHNRERRAIRRKLMAAGKSGVEKVSLHPFEAVRIRKHGKKKLARAK